MSNATTVWGLWVTDSGLIQIDDVVLRISTILRKAGSIKNYFAPINQIPQETLALAATFLAKERDLLNATAVCQHWRATLLSFPRLWHNPGGSTSELGAYLERSKSVPIEVNLSSPHLVVSIIPHTFRLAALSIYTDFRGLREITEHLRDPIPTLRSLAIRLMHFDLLSFQLLPGLGEGLFRHLDALSLNVIPSFHGPRTFPHITQLFLSGVSAYQREGAIAVLNALELLPGLVKVSITFRGDWYGQIGFPHIVTLPCVQAIHLSASTDPAARSLEAIPPILRFLKLPKATSVTLRSRIPLKTNLSILPDARFCEQLPNYAELPELRINTTMFTGTAVFQSPSQAVLTYHGEPLEDYKRESSHWRGLPLSSVRRVTITLVDPELCQEDVWLVDMIGDLDSLELLDLGGDCGRVLQRLRHRLVRGAMRTGIKALIVRGGEYARDQALKLESVKDGLGLGDMTVTYILDPEVNEGLTQDPDTIPPSDDDFSDSEDFDDDDDD